MLRPMTWEGGRRKNGARRALSAAFLVGIVLTASSACSVDRPESADSSRGEATQQFDSVEGTVRVFAASSLSNAFEDLVAAFERLNPGITVDVNFGGSSSLREQILDGAPVDVFAAASESVMADLTANDQAFIDAVNFASNQLVLATPAANTGAVSDLDALTDASLLVGLCAPQVPCGELAAAALEARNIEPQVDSYEPNVRALTARLIDGELDAGLIYATDAAHAVDRVLVIERLPESVNRYPIAAKSRAGDLFVDYVTSVAGQAVLAEFGFGRP